MDCNYCAVVIYGTLENSWLLEAQMGLFERYKSGLQWPVYYATKKTSDAWIQKICNKYNVNLIPIEDSIIGIIQTYIYVMKQLPDNIQIVLPLRDDILLDRPGINVKDIESALELFTINKNIFSLRCMPCPASSNTKAWFDNWSLFGENDPLFSFQATLWRRDSYVAFFEKVITFYCDDYPVLDPTSYAFHELLNKENPCESRIGTLILQSHWPQALHLCYKRKGTWANAVYYTPIPYRPGATKDGQLEAWANEFIRREGFYLYTSKRT